VLVTVNDRTRQQSQQDCREHSAVSAGRTQHILQPTRLPPLQHYLYYVYLHYNATFRRAYLRMVRCQSDPVDDDQSASVTRKVKVAVIPRDRAAASAAYDERISQRPRTPGRGPDGGKEIEPSTSQYRYGTDASGTAWTHSNTEQSDASYAQRY